MAILIVVFAVLVVSYASSLRAYRNQRGDIDALRAQIASSTTDIGRLQREKGRWADQAYIEQQARARFGWVLPGETAYQVVGRDGKPLGSDDRLSDPNAVIRTAPTSWWAKEYSSLEKADHPPTVRKLPPPAARITPRSPSR